MKMCIEEWEDCYSTVNCRCFAFQGSHAGHGKNRVGQVGLGLDWNALRERTAKGTVA